MSRPVLLLAALAGLLASAADAQPASPGGHVRFRQPVGDGYEVRIRTDFEAECPEGEGALFTVGGEASPFESVRPGDGGCPPTEMLSLWHHGALIDSVGGWRLWLGAPVDTLLWENLEPEDHPLPDGAVRDLTGDGVPELIVGVYSGGAHCCTGVLVVSLGEMPAFLGEIDASDSVVVVEDTESGPVFRLADFTFAYWNTSFAGSPAPAVTLAWDAEAQTFLPSARHMRQPPLPDAELAALTAEVRAADVWRTRRFPPEAYWGTLLDLLYAGRSAQAERFAREAWMLGDDARALFLGWFRDQLWQSPYAPAVFEMNDGADWL